MTTHFDELETRSGDERLADQMATLRRLIGLARGTAPGLAAHLEGVDLDSLTGPSSLATLPVLRKADLVAMQTASRPFGGLTTRAANAVAHVFQSPGPIYEPGGNARDWWRMGRFLHAAGIGAGDIVQNCFSYHLTPAGMIFENGAMAVGATVVPAGTGQTEQQVRAAHDIGVTAYAGTPDFLKVILDKAPELGLTLGIEKAVVGGGALFPSLRQEYADRGIACLQCYATADLGNIAYESPAMEGMIIDEGVIVEIVRPGTGDPVEPGEVGEVVVTSLNADYPLVRFATGDLSAVLPGQSPCGRTNMRIKGWMGRADQTTKVKGMFVRPEQVADFVARHDSVTRARLTVTREDERDVLAVAVEGQGDQGLEADLASSVRDVFKLRAEVRIVAEGSLPNDGKVIDDQRSYET